MDIAPGSEEENAHGERECKDNMITSNTILLYIFFCQYEEVKIKRERRKRRWKGEGKMEKMIRRREY